MTEFDVLSDSVRRFSVLFQSSTKLLHSLADRTEKQGRPPEALQEVAVAIHCFNSTMLQIAATWLMIQLARAADEKERRCSLQ